MSKQEEIRAEIADLCRIMREEGQIRRFTPDSDALGILDYLHSQGVVVKAENSFEFFQAVSDNPRYVAVEPLIEG